jgi:hypothetical protein
MKTSLIVVLIWAAGACAQEKNVFVNFQFHRDFHRENFTSTVEVLEFDKYGTTFFFADFDFDSVGETGSYFEIARNLTCYRAKRFAVNAALQYNDGVLPFDGEFGKGIPRTWLGGVAISDLKVGSSLWEFQVLARQEFAADLGWQLTAVWSYVPVATWPLSLSGFADWNTNETNDQPTSFQAEPQLIYEFGGHWGVGGELEISRNFVGAFTKQHGFEYRRWYTHPTLLVRVDF